MRRRLAAALSVILGLSFAVAVPAVASAEPVQAPPVVINELQSNDPSKAKDWVELYNPGTEVADLSGWKVRDNSSAGEALPQNTVVPAGGYLVLSQDTHFTFGLGNGDEFHLATPDGTEVDSMTYAAH
ncbi:MAG: lamin tail domain-containing protein, partial [Micrococcales bacterium]|nr:lamin tail domain-containing protein [Micrococcales bacterium]